MRAKRFWIYGFLIVILCFLVYRFNSRLWVWGVEAYNVLGDREALKGVLSSYGSYSPFIFILIQGLQVVVALVPGVVIEFVGGYLFGVWPGFIYSMLGITVGSCVAFLLGRVFERKVVERVVSPGVLRKFDYLVSHEGVVITFLIFLIPGFPKDALCYILGLTSMRMGGFLLLSSIGRIPGVLLLTLQGAKAFDQQYEDLLVLIGLSLIVVVTFYLYHDEVYGLIKKMKRW